MPDTSGVVTLDIFMEQINTIVGSFILQNIEHPISVARKVMEETPHVMLSGKDMILP